MTPLSETETGPRRPATLRRYRDLPEAIVAKSVLDAADIPSCLADDVMIRMNWFLSNALGGVKLWVLPEDLPQGNDLLNQNMQNIFDVDGLGEYKQPRCPYCQSLALSEAGFRKLGGPGNRVLASIVLVLLRALGYVLLQALLKGDSWECGDCGRRWRDTAGKRNPLSQGRFSQS